MHRRAFIGGLLGSGIIPSASYAQEARVAGASYLIHSIDRTTNDNGALNCLRRHMTPYLPNSSTLDVVSNFLSVSSSGRLRARIVGHAAPGLILTSCGQYTCGPDTYISTWNEYHWGPLISLLAGVVDRIELWGCHPGAEEDGAELLFAMAKRANCSVAGLSGLLYCRDSSGPYAEPGSVWVEATPNQKPTPVDPPSLFGATVITIQSPQRIRVRRNGELITITPDRILRLEILSPSGQADVSAVHFARNEFSDTLRFIRLDMPTEIPGPPMAIETCRLRIVFEDADQEIAIELAVWNDKLATYPDFSLGYPLHPLFKAFREHLDI